MPPFFDINGDPTMDPYTILSLPPTATDLEIKKAYRMQMLQLHPDKLAPTLSENSIAAVTDKFHNVKDAYEFLMSPIHLTSRRLYMAKMASRRAEYERREAFLRRNGGMMNGTNYSSAAFASQVPSGYHSGGGGAAGMAGTGMMPPPSSNQHKQGSYPVPPRKDKTMGRSKSEPHFGEGDVSGGYTKDNNKYRRNSQNPPPPPPPPRGRTGKPKMHNSHPTTTKKKDRRENKAYGYKSDTAGVKPTTTTKSSRDKHRSKSKKAHDGTTTTTNNKGEKVRTRGKSEPKRRSESKHYDESYEGGGDSNKKTTTKEQQRSSKPAARKNEKFEQKRRRAKSAPARYSSKNPSSNNNKYSKEIRGSSKDRGSTDTPKEFFCPLTKRLMKDPVRDSEGNTYEREAIERWLRVQSSSPITNGYLSLDMLRPDRELKRAIYKATGKPRSKSQNRTKSRSTSPTNIDDLISGRVLIDSYLREISSKSKLSVSLDGMGICAFSYRRITFVIEVPITPNAGFMVYSSFEGNADRYKLSEKMDAWNGWLVNIGRASKVSHVKAGQKTVFTLKGSEKDMSRCDVFQKTLEYFVEMSLKLHNVLHPGEVKVVENVCLTRAPVAVA